MSIPFLFALSAFALALGLLWPKRSPETGIHLGVLNIWRAPKDRALYPASEYETCSRCGVRVRGAHGSCAPKLAIARGGSRRSAVCS